MFMHIKAIMKDPRHNVDEEYIYIYIERERDYVYSVYSAVLQGLGVTAPKLVPRRSDSIARRVPTNV